MCDCLENLLTACNINVQGSDGKVITNEETISYGKDIVPYSNESILYPTTTSKFIFTMFENQTFTLTNSVITSPVLPNPITLYGYLPLSTSEIYFNGINGSLDQTNDAFVLPPGKYFIEVLYNTVQYAYLQNNTAVNDSKTFGGIYQGDSFQTRINLSTSIYTNPNSFGTITLQSSSGTVSPSNTNITIFALHPQDISSNTNNISQNRVTYLLESNTTSTNKIQFSLKLNTTTDLQWNSANLTYNNVSALLFPYFGSTIIINKI